MMTHEKAAQVLGTARNQNDGKPLGRNTRLFKKGEDFVIQFHRTNVVTIHADGTYTLNSGGWQTSTTKERINEFSPVRIYQKSFAWYVMPAYNPRLVENEKPSLPPTFEDGMRVDHAGFVV